MTAQNATDDRSRINGDYVARLKRSNQELSDFAYIASHDMQEPLRMIVNFSEMIRQDYREKLDEQGREYLTIVTESAARMQKMVDDLLDYARLGKEAIRFAAFAPEDELKHALENLSALTRGCNAEITHGALPRITGNPGQFMRLIQNLIVNGLKYQAPGNKPCIRIAAADEGLNWHFTIGDNGIGIDESFIKEVFEPFRRLHTWEQIKGTGLGLSVCKKIVENHGGTLWATSIPGQGSVFHFTIPKAISATEAA